LPIAVFGRWISGESVDRNLGRGPKSGVGVALPIGRARRNGACEQQKSHRDGWNKSAWMLAQRSILMRGLVAAQLLDLIQAQAANVFSRERPNALAFRLVFGGQEHGSGRDSARVGHAREPLSRVPWRKRRRQHRPPWREWRAPISEQLSRHAELRVLDHGRPLAHPGEKCRFGACPHRFVPTSVIVATTIAEADRTARVVPQLELMLLSGARRRG